MSIRTPSSGKQIEVGLLLPAFWCSIRFIISQGCSNILNGRKLFCIQSTCSIPNLGAWKAFGESQWRHCPGSWVCAVCITAQQRTKRCWLKYGQGRLYWNAHPCTVNFGERRTKCTVWLIHFFTENCVCQDDISAFQLLEFEMKFTKVKKMHRTCIVALKTFWQVFYKHKRTVRSKQKYSEYLADKVWILWVK